MCGCELCGGVASTLCTSTCTSIYHKSIHAIHWDDKKVILDSWKEVLQCLSKSILVHEFYVLFLLGSLAMCWNH